MLGMGGCRQIGIQERFLVRDWLSKPVITVEANDPMQKASEEAGRLLTTHKELDLMLACAFDSCSDNEDKEQLSVTFTLVDKND